MKKQQEEERIYVILPVSVQFDGIEPGSKSRRKVRRSLVLSHGMLMAQSAHVVSKMRVDLHRDYGRDPITTIVLSVRNSKELIKVGEEMIRELSDGVWQFHDNNKGLYGGDANVLTAICTRPLKRSEVESLIGHLELF